MWFRIGIKDTKFERYIELDSEDNVKILHEWFELANEVLNPVFVLREEISLVFFPHIKYPKICEVEMMERPPQEWLKDEIEWLNKCIDEDTERHNRLSDLLHSYSS